MRKSKLKNIVWSPSL